MKKDQIKRLMIVVAATVIYVIAVLWLHSICTVKDIYANWLISIIAPFAFVGAVAIVFIAGWSICNSIYDYIKYGS